MNDFWLSTLSGTLSGILSGFTLGLLPLTALFGDKKEKERRTKKVNNINRGNGSQVIIGDDNYGEISVTVNNKPTIIIKSHIEESLPPAGNSERVKEAPNDLWIIALVGLAMVVLFLIFFPIIFWIAIGMIIGLTSTLLTAIVRTSSAGIWSWRAAGVVAEACIAIATTIYSWVSVFNLQWHGYKLETLAERVEKASNQTKITDHRYEILERFIAHAAELFKVDWPWGLPFTLSLAGAAVLSGAMLVFSWSSIFDWTAYVRLFSGKSRKGTALRAVRFERRNWSHLVGTIVIATVTVAFATGFLLTLYGNQLTELQVPTPTKH